LQSSPQSHSNIHCVVGSHSGYFRPRYSQLLPELNGYVPGPIPFIPLLERFCSLRFSFRPSLLWPKLRPPYEIEHHKDFLSYLQKNRHPGDIVYVFPLPSIGVRFYGPRFGLQRSDWIASVCDTNETRAYIKDVDRFRGAPRLWILTGGSRPFRFARAAVLQYLGAIGKRTDLLSLPSSTYGSVTLELYNLSDPARLSQADAETFPAPPMATDPRPGCREWVSHWPGE
jgi:hypothetical protein